MATPLQDKDLCFWHDPEHQQEAAEARRLGASDGGLRAPSSGRTRSASWTMSRTYGGCCRLR